MAEGVPYRVQLGLLEELVLQENRTEVRRVLLAITQSVKYAQNVEASVDLIHQLNDEEHF